MKANNLIIATLLIFPISAYAEFPIYPTTTIIHPKNGDRNAIYVDCDLKTLNPETIECSFFQMTLSLKTNPDEVEEKIAKLIKYLETDKRFLKDPVEEVKKLCFKDKQSESYNKLWKEVKNMEEGKAKEYKKFIFALGEKSCDISTAEEAKSLSRKLIEISTNFETVSCKVWSNTWKETFEYKKNYNQPSYWLAQPKPSGDCGVINVSTFKQVENKMFWDYESRRIVTNKEGEGLLWKCDTLEERTVSYGWDSEATSIECQEVSFGLF